MATINPTNKSESQFGASVYCDNFRDERLKINDDRKVKLTLSDFKDENVMILLTLKTNDIKKEKVNPSAYAKAWFRLQNEDTNQTLDYSYIKDVLEKEGIEDDEEAVDAGDEDEEEDAEQSERIE